MKFSCLIYFNYEEFLPNHLQSCFPELAGSLGKKAWRAWIQSWLCVARFLLPNITTRARLCNMVQLLLTHLLWEIPLLFIPDSTFLHQLLSYTSAILPSLKMYLVPGACFYQLASWDIHWLTAGIHFAEMPLHGHLILETTGDQSFETQSPCYGQETSGSATISSHTST